METIYSTIQRYQLDLFQVSVTCLAVFVFGYWMGYSRSKKLERKMHKMEKEIRDLNTELLYGK